MGSIAEVVTAPLKELQNGSDLKQHKEPSKPTGVLDQYKHFDVTPVIGREYPTLDLKELLEAPNSDELLKDLAITSKHNKPDRSDHLG